MSDWIHLEQIRFPCKIGTYWAEQQREQPLEVGVHFALDLTPAAAEDLSRSIDYAQVLLQVELIARHGRWRLLESLSLTLVRWFLLEPARGESRGSAVRVRVGVKKPEAVAGRAVPTVEIERGRNECRYQHVDLGGGAQQIVVGETEFVRVSRLEMPAGGRLRPAQAALALPLTGASAKNATSLDAQGHWVEGELVAEGEPAAWLLLQGPAVAR